MDSDDGDYVFCPSVHLHSNKLTALNALIDKVGCNSIGSGLKFPVGYFPSVINNSNSVRVLCYSFGKKVKPCDGLIIFHILALGAAKDLLFIVFADHPDVF